MKLAVPYYSQFLDVDDKRWMPKSCAIVCLKMILDYHKIGVPTLSELISNGEKIGGYGSSGWYHNAIIKLAEAFGLKAHRVEGVNAEDGIKDIKNSLKKGNPVIVSAIKRIFGQTKFHTVVITGFEEINRKITGFYYNDPESSDREKGRDLFVDIADFLDGWRRMAIFFRDPTLKI